MSRSCTDRILARICGGAILSYSAAALAQTAPAQNPPATSAGDQLQEVVVTAQFRSESVQQTPLAITAINAAMLEQRNQTNLAQVAAQIPSTTLLPAEAAFGPSMTASIRGIGQYDFDPALEPGVGIYVDDVYFSTLTGSQLDLLDLDRVEVLRGPQGTLAGMNSIGGAVKLFSKKPDGNEESNVSLLYGSRNHTELRANGDFAVVPDQVFVRVSGVYNHQDGYLNVYDFGCANPTFTATSINPVTNAPAVTGTYSVGPSAFLTHSGDCKTGEEGGTNYGAIRLALRWSPNDRIDVNLVGDVTQQNQENSASALLYANYPLTPRNPKYYSAITIQTTNGALLPYNQTLVPALIPSNRYASYASFSMPAAAGAPAYSGSDSTRLLSWGGSATIDVRLTDLLSVKSITALRGYSTDWFEDNDASPWPLGLGGEHLEHHQFSQELRLNGSVAHLLDYTLGGFYFSQLSVYGTHQDLWYAAGPGGLDFLGQDPIPAHDKAGFVHTVWHLTSKLDLTAAVRYTSQDKDYTYSRQSPQGGTGGSAALVGPLNGFTGHYSANKVDYRGDIDFHFTDDLMGYAQVTTGFKGGGVNPRPFFTFQAVHFNPETVRNYEIGIKSAWLDHSLRVNLDAYFADYKDIQLTLLSCGFLNPPPLAGAPLPCALPFNAGNAHIKGAELEVEEHPFGGLELNASASYLNFNYTSLTSYPTGVNLEMRPAFTARWQGSFGIQYRVPAGELGSFTPRFDANTRSDIYTNSVNGPLNHIGGYTIVNGRVTWQPKKDNWQVSLEALNLGGKFYYLNKFDLTGAGAGLVTGTPAPPREVAIEVKHTM